MAQTERLYRLKHFFDTGRCFSKAYLLDQLGISVATLKRDIAHLQDRMNCPIFYDHHQGGYKIDPARQAIGTQYELPGLLSSLLLPDEIVIGGKLTDDRSRLGADAWDGPTNVCADLKLTLTDYAYVR